MDTHGERIAGAQRGRGGGGWPRTGQISGASRRWRPGTGRDLRRAAQAQDRQGAIVSEIANTERRAGRKAARSSSRSFMYLVRREVPEPLVGPLRIEPLRVPLEVVLDAPERPVEEESPGVLLLHAAPESLEEGDGA